MAGSSFGTIFKITTWGESHGKGLGVVVDGCPAGLPLDENDIQKFLNRRKPGQSKFTTPRKEDDAVEILSGVFEGKTTGTPISLVVYNQNQKSKDYSEIASYYRPGHADYTFDQKYGFRDYRGGGRSSGRETIGRVAAGAIAVKILNQLGITFLTYTRSIGPISISSQNFDAAQINEKSSLIFNSLAQNVSHLGTFYLHIIFIIFIYWHNQRHPLSNAKAITLQTSSLSRIVSHKTNAAEAQISQNLSTNAIIPLIRSKAQQYIGLYSILALILQLVGTHLVSQTNTSALLTHIEKNRWNLPIPNYEIRISYGKLKQNTGYLSAQEAQPPYACLRRG